MLSQYLRCCILFVVCLFLSLPARAQDADKSLAVLIDGLGTYSRPISTDSDLAQKFFDQGLRLTWGYYFPEAIGSHQEALRHDTDNPVINWGIALAAAPNPNSRYMQFRDDPAGAGRQAIIRAREFIHRTNEKEQALIEAVFVRYDTDSLADGTERDQSYFEAIRELALKFPDDPDIATLYADAYMTMTAWNYWDSDGRARPGTEEVAKALEESMALNPNHPGTNHLYIHLIEASPTPERALPQADRLASLMPNAGHIVHMPGHIYLRVGQYNKAIATNERSLAADQILLKAWGDRPFPRLSSFPSSSRDHGGHSMDFVRYAAGVQGNYAQAVEAATQSAKLTPEIMIRRGRGQKAIATEWFVHKMFGKWDRVLESMNEWEGLPYLDRVLLYAKGSAHLNLGDIAQAEQALSTLHSVMTDDSLESTLIVANSGKSLLQIAALGLEGEIKQASGDLEGAIAVFETAVQRNDSMRYMEPPDWALPMRHYLGTALLEAGRHGEAERVFREDLAWNQGNGWALYGLWQSLIAQGKATESATVKMMFDNAWKSADTELTAARF